MDQRYRDIVVDQAIAQTDAYALQKMAAARYLRQLLADARDGGKLSLADLRRAVDDLMAEVDFRTLIEQVDRDVPREMDLDVFGALIAILLLLRLVGALARLYSADEEYFAWLAGLEEDLTALLARFRVS